MSKKSIRRSRWRRRGGDGEYLNTSVLRKGRNDGFYFMILKRLEEALHELIL